MPPKTANHKNGKACNKKSNQSKGVIPIEPPAIHFILPHKCGSGKKGANPSVKVKKKGIFALFKNFILSFFNPDEPI